MNRGIICQRCICSIRTEIKKFHFSQSSAVRLSLILGFKKKMQIIEQAFNYLTYTLVLNTRINLFHILRLGQYKFEYSVGETACQNSIGYHRTSPSPFPLPSLPYAYCMNAVSQPSWLYPPFYSQTPTVATFSPSSTSVSSIFLPCSITLLLITPPGRM